MEPIRVVTGIAVPLRHTNVDTDQIIPARFMKRVTKHGYEDGLFDAWRADPDFVLNQLRYAHPRVLVAGSNFGSGSSREHAVWALRDFGFRAVLAPSFADIFRGNAAKQGLLAATIDLKYIDELWDAIEARPGQETTVDLEHHSISLHNRGWRFEIDDDTRWRLMEGIDDIALTLRESEAITAFEAKRPSWLPRTLPVAPTASLEPSSDSQGGRSSTN